MPALKPKSALTKNNPNQTEAVLTEKPVAVYYRQSTLAQVGNNSTAIQTIDMPAELVRRGWKQDDIILIDDDEGVSGTKRIDERVGMTYLFELIADRKIGAVACQDEDRLFRDWTQIQVNIFLNECRKSDVKVVTPSFTYDFAHPLYGDFHARQFRFKCDMAAEYIKTYILGRLTPAKRRIMNEGKWAGAKIPVGFMVDTRIALRDGSENPTYRKFVPFEPYAEIVREHFNIFLECGGKLRKAMRVIRERRISFPDCPPPDGFRANYKLKWREHGYYINKGSYKNLLTNPMYIGHWCTEGAVILWNNHEPIVEVDTFMQAFNYLSKIGLDGEDNPDYQPSHQWDFSGYEGRPVEHPMCADLIYTKVGERWFRAGVKYDKKCKCYLYAAHSTDDLGVNTEWMRRVAWIDSAVVGLFRKKLTETFQSQKWAQAMQETDQILERERKVKRLTLAAHEEEKQNLVISLGTIKIPELIQGVERRYEQIERDIERLNKDLARIDQETYRTLSIQEAFALFERAVSQWDDMTPDEQRNTLRMAVYRIEASDYNRAGDLRLLVRWRDGNTNELQIWHKSKAAHWTIENTQLLLALAENGAGQLELAEAFPELKWHQIYNELRKHRGIARFTPSYLGKNETYTDYVARGGGKGKATSSRWLPEELEQLKEMVERQATQLEIMQACPHRKWIQIQSRISVIFGKGIRIPREGEGITQRLSYVEYVQQSQTAHLDYGSEIGGRCW